MAHAFSVAWYERGLRFKTASLITAGVAALAGILIAYRTPNPSWAGAFAVVGIAAVAIWMLSSAKTHLTLAALMLYLGLADGVIKLMSGSSSATLGRDMLLYAIVIGILLKRTVRKERFSAPPMTGWIIAFVAAVLVQLLNPGDVSFSHSFASTRPEIEFVPLFFLGHSVMRSQRRIKAFLLMLMAIAAINGVVGLVQFSMSPSSLANWGPGYAADINGTNGLSSRVFWDSSGKTHVRPFALGSDEGFGGSVGVLAVPAALALLTLIGNARLKIAAGVLSAGVVLGIVTSQGRISIVGGVAAIVAFIMLSTASKRLGRLLLTLAIALAIGYVAISTLASHSSSHLFDRYSNITPGKLFSTGYNYRADTNTVALPRELVTYPLGAGIGKVGPAANSAGSTGNFGLDAESEPTYLVLDVGIPGLLVMLGFQLRLMRLSLRIRRRKDMELRLLLAALAAPLFALFLEGWDAATTNATPNSPYLWFVGGALTYWLISACRGSGDAHSAE